MHVLTLEDYNKAMLEEVSNLNQRPASWRAKTCAANAARSMSSNEPKLQYGGIIHTRASSWRGLPIPRLSNDIYNAGVQMLAANMAGEYLLPMSPFNE